MSQEKNTITNKEKISTTCIKDGETIYLPFSVAISVYKKDNASWFNIAMESLINQTVEPNEIVLVVDGPVTNEIQRVINKYIKINEAKKIEFKVILLKENQGHGIARRKALEHCTNDLVAIMDADDICVGDRFEQQLLFIQKHDVDIVGGDIEEFMEESSNITAKRIVPQTDKEIKEYMKKRCPFNQMTVMFRKHTIQNVGGYLDWYCNEDYYLWIRMCLKGCRMANTGTVLVKARINNETYKRRGGWKYFLSEKSLQKFMLNNNMINFIEYVENIVLRLIVQVLLPNNLRKWVYKKIIRSKQ